MDGFFELDRSDVPCGCGCGRSWLLSRGHLELAGRTTSYVVVPTRHDEQPIAWLALGDGREPSAWVFVRSTLIDGNVAAGVVNPDQSPLGSLTSLAGAARLTREQAIADAAAKARVFEVHDALLRQHADLQQLFVPERGRDWSFQMPDCVFARPPAERSKRNNKNFAEHEGRLFVRALLPVPLSDGGEVRVGVWVEVASEAFFALMRAWDEPEAYLSQRLSGPVENALTVGGHALRGETVHLAPRTADQCLFVSGAEPPWLAQLMRDGVSVAALPALVSDIERSLRRSPARS